ncbi:MAG: hypothetical protein LBU23_13185, partial [Planctomycetota bacterium]|nr:hypothetical protein [Planctomycetota bacterium]
MRQYQDAPIKFCLQALRLEPTEQQAAFLTALTVPGARVAVKSGHGVGKSTVFAMAALWFLCTRHDGVVPCTAPTAHQLRDVLWREVRKCAGRMSSWWREQIVVLDDTVRLKCSAARILARTARREQPDALQGFHEKHLLFLIDEAAGVADAVFEVARGALSTPNARVAMAGNPTRLTGYFHAAFHAARDSWERLTFSCLDSPLVSPAFPADIAAEFGQDSDVYRVRVLGEFPLSGPMAVIPLELVEAAMARTLPANFQNPAAKILGVDLALEGEDRTVIALRQGVQARIVFSGRLRQTSQLLARIAQAIDEERPDAVFADKGGMGAPIIHSLNDLGRKVIGINFGDPALDKDRFVRKREEMWWLMREWLER